MSKQGLITALNEDLAAEWGTIIRYTYQAGKSFGILGAELPEMELKLKLEEMAADEAGHARELRRLSKGF